MASCELCPRGCKADRVAGVGFCGAGEEMRVAKIMLHRYEEPPISGSNGSGAIFFAHCNLKCCFCQNGEISRVDSVKDNESSFTTYSPKTLAEEFYKLQDSGAHNINLVTAAHYLPQVILALKIAKPRLKIPVVYNSSGYEYAEQIAALDGLVEVFLPDYKFFSGELSGRYCGAPDYPQVARAAIVQMLKISPKIELGGGLLKRGVIIRHLVMPSHRDDSIAVMRDIATLGGGALISLMSQYTPSFNSSGYKNLDRKVTSFEYNAVLAEVNRLGLDGFMQSRDSAISKYTPKF